MAPPRAGRDHRRLFRIDAKGAPPARRFTLSRLASFQRWATDDHERRSLVAARRRRQSGAEIQKILHRREIRRRRSRKKIRRVGQTHAAVVYQKKISRTLTASIFTKADRVIY